MRSMKANVIRRRNNKNDSFNHFLLRFLVSSFPLYKNAVLINMYIYLHVAFEPKYVD